MTLFLRKNKIYILFFLIVLFFFQPIFDFLSIEQKNNREKCYAFQEREASVQFELLKSSNLINIDIEDSLKNSISKVEEKSTKQVITIHQDTIKEYPSPTVKKDIDTNSRKAITKKKAKKEKSYTQEDLEMIAHLIWAEAEGESYKGKLAVGFVVLNRTKSKDFPNTIKGVVLQNNDGTYQFSSVIPGGRYYQGYDEACLKAAKEVLSGQIKNFTEGALYFDSFDPQNSWNKGKHEFIMRIGKHYFYR